ncbi:MAG: DUF4491 family protein [Bacteroidaceae bacterium]|nr:DUF4491 family protein [Bacteroidaceae bacterium]MBR4782704.1 DUF4491 family protein [Bacteroidaceae bacterium]
MEALNWLGLIVGACSFLIIGLFHPIVIKAEYHTGTRYWWAFLLVGVAAAAAALIVESPLLSSVLGVFAFCCWWSIKELFEQRKRVEKGWFPKKERKG